MLVSTKFFDKISLLNKRKCGKRDAQMDGLSTANNPALKSELPDGNPYTNATDPGDTLLVVNNKDA